MRSAPFARRTSWRGTSDVEDAGELGFDVWCGTPRAGHRMHTHHDVEVNYLFKGWVEYVMGGQRVRLEAGRAYLFWATVPHQMVACAEQTDVAWIVLPVTWLWRWGLPGSMSAALLEGDVLGDAQSESADAEAMKRWSGMLAKADDRWQRIAELEIEARFRRMILHGLDPLTWQSTRESTPSRAVAASAVREDGQAKATRRSTEECSEDSSPESSKSGLAAVEAMAAFITSHHAEPMRVADVAAAVSLHPHYAMRLFRRHMGMTLIDYLTKQRIAEAQRRLMTSDDKVLTIAFECGFGSASRFHAAFRRYTDTTPHRYRRSLRQGHPNRNVSR